MEDKIKKEMMNELQDAELKMVSGGGARRLAGMMGGMRKR